MTAPEAQVLQASAARLGFDLGADAIERLGRFLDLLVLWNRRVHLTGERSRPALVGKHIADALAPVPCLPSSGTVVDIGSGAGFPGIVLACVRSDLHFVLVESRRRRASFLAEASRHIPLPNVRVEEMRAEDISRPAGGAPAAEIVISRALKVDAFLRLAVPFLAPRGTAIAMQTPRGLAAARRIAGDVNCDLVGTRDYLLPGGERRTLLLFARRESGRPVS